MICKLMLISWLYGNCVISTSVEDALFMQVAIGTRFNPLSNRAKYYISKDRARFNEVAQCVTHSATHIASQLILLRIVFGQRYLLPTQRGRESSYTDRQGRTYFNKMCSYTPRSIYKNCYKKQFLYMCVNYIFLRIQKCIYAIGQHYLMVKINLRPEVKS